MTLAKEADIRTSSFNFTVLKFLLVEIVEVSQRFWHRVRLLTRLQCPDEISCACAFFGCDESDGISFVAGTTCAAYSMDVVFQMRRTHIVYY